MTGSLLLFVLLTQAKNAPHPMTDAERAKLAAKTGELSAAVDKLRSQKIPDDILVDIEIFAKAGQWLHRYPAECYQKKTFDDALKLIDIGLDRAQQVKSSKDKPAWTKPVGRLVLGYRSAVDGGVQPYSVTVPTNYVPNKKHRLDVVLHGRGATLSEVTFLASHLPEAKPRPPSDAIELEVFGRTNNAYRWSGEADVFEALADVKRRYKIDDSRIVLRGFSMGGAGTWHIGLHYPHLWAAIEAGAGFTDTLKYTKKDSLPEPIRSTLHIYDAVDYSLNAANVPTVGYGGEEDPQLQGATNIREKLTELGVQFKKENFAFTTKDISALFLIGPKTGHKFEPESKKRSDAFIASQLRRPEPNRLRFVTYTVRYGVCDWLRVEGLGKHYQEATVDAEWDPKNHAAVLRTKNVTHLTVQRKGLQKLTVDEQTLAGAGDEVRLLQTDGQWSVTDSAPAILRKRPGLQGPVDDAFMEPFVCVRPTGKPRNESTHQHAVGMLDRFAAEYAKWLRADLPIVDDTAVTDAMIEHKHLVVFGDPASNAYLAKIGTQLPINWGPDELAVGSTKFSSAEHLPVLIYPNPLNPSKYVVVNSGHTFGEADFIGTNALLYPRLGDVAVLKLPTKGTASAVDAVAAGFFDERWKNPHLFTTTK